jgi:serine/threonine protein kinase
VFDGKYEVLELLGSGGMGDVYKVWHRKLAIHRVVKVMRANLFQDPTARVRFNQEAQVASRLMHPHLAVLYDFAETPDGVHYMVWEYLQGITVREMLHYQSPVPPRVAAYFALQALDGLGHLHRHGIVHRDISPENLMVVRSEGRPEVKIIDFGIAKLVSEFPDRATASGAFVGKLKYSSPEQMGMLASNEVIDGRSDLYAFGVVLYEIVAGRPPFESKTPQGYIVGHCHNSPPRLKDVAPNVDVSPTFEAILFQALEKDRRKRFRDAAEFAEAIRDWVRETVPSGSVDSVLLEEANRQISVEALRAIEKASARGAAPSSSKPADKTEPYEPEEMAGGPPAAGSSTDLGAPRPASSSPASGSLRAPSRPASPGTLQSTIVTPGGRRDSERALSPSPPPGGREPVRGEPSVEELEKEERALQEKLREARAWARAEGLESASGWKEYLDDFSGSHRAGQARARFEEVGSFENCLKRAESSAWDDFLARWPSGSFVSDARSRRAECRREEERRAWEEAELASSTGAWMSYLEGFPDSERTALARERLGEQRDFDLADRAATSAAWDRFLECWPQSSRAGEAEQIRGRLREKEISAAFDEADQAETTRAWRDFLGRFSESAAAREARQRLLELESFEKANRIATSDAWLSFLDDHPSCRLTSRAQEAYRTARERECEAAWLVALRRNSLEKWRDFLSEFPDSRHAEEAAARTYQLEDWAAAESAATPEGWDAFLSKWEGSPLGPAARRKRDDARQRQEQAEWARAETSDSAAGWSLFLERFGNSVLADTARSRQEEAEAFDRSRVGGRAELESFARRWPRTRRGLEAKALAESLRQQEVLLEARALDTVGGWRRLLESAPSPEGRVEAEKRLASLEEAALARALDAARPEAAAEFLSEFPKSPRANQVREAVRDREDERSLGLALSALRDDDPGPAEEFVRSAFDSKRKELCSEKLAAWRQMVADRDDRAAFEEAFRALDRGETETAEEYVRSSVVLARKEECARRIALHRQQEADRADRAAWETALRALTAGNTAPAEAYVKASIDPTRKAECERRIEEYLAALLEREDRELFESALDGLEQRDFTPAETYLQKGTNPTRKRDCRERIESLRRILLEEKDAELFTRAIDALDREDPTLAEAYLGSGASQERRARCQGLLTAFRETLLDRQDLGRFEKALAGLESGETISAEGYLRDGANSDRRAECSRRLDRFLAERAQREKARDLEAARAKDRIEDWRRFLARYPESAEAAEASRHIEELERIGEQRDFEAARVAGSTKHWQEFLGRWPQSRLAPVAQQAIDDDQELSRARSLRSRAGVKKFLEAHPDSFKADEARGLLEQLEAEFFEETRRRDNLVEWRRYLETNPVGAFAEKARARLEELEREAYERVRIARDPRAARRFLEAFPDAVRRSDVVGLIEDVEDEDRYREAVRALGQGEERLARAYMADGRDGARRDALTERVLERAKAEAEAESRRQREVEAERQREVEAQRQREVEAQRQREVEAQRQRELEAQHQLEVEAQRQREVEAQRQRELEAERQREVEAQRQREVEAQRQREVEAQRQREVEAQRQREVDDQYRRGAEPRATAPLPPPSSRGLNASLGSWVPNTALGESPVSPAPIPAEGETGIQPRDTTPLRPGERSSGREAEPPSSFPHVPPSADPAVEATLANAFFGTETTAPVDPNQALQIARKKDSPHGWQMFLVRYPDSSGAAEARGRLAEMEEAEYRKIRSSRDANTLRRFIERFPTGAHTQEIRQKLRRLPRR